HFSPQRVQHIAALACKDFAKDEPDWLADLEALASLGTHGAHANNIHRDLMAKMQALPRLPEPFHAKLKFAEPLGWQDQGIMLPHEMFSAIYHKYPKTWRKSVLPSEHKLHEWWEHVEEHPQMLNHPIKTRDQRARWGVPLAIHGDGVPITGIGKGWCKLMTMFTWSSLLGSGSTLDMLFWIWSVFDKLCIASSQGHVAYVGQLWVTAVSIALDYMHCKYLGSDMYQFGSVLYMLCYFVLTGLWGAHMNGALELHRKVHLMLKLNVRMETLLTEYRDESALPPAAAREFTDACQNMMLLYTQLAEHFVQEGEKLFDITSKSHMVMHSAILSKYLSPRRVWCFAGEDMMGKTQILAKSCVRGISGAAATVKFAKHYRLGLHLLFDGHD
ncbi:unnamed protein product, partial [Polarella glacialis]